MEVYELDLPDSSIIATSRNIVGSQTIDEDVRMLFTASVGGSYRCRLYATAADIKDEQTSPDVTIKANNTWVSITAPVVGKQWFTIVDAKDDDFGATEFQYSYQYTTIGAQDGHSGAPGGHALPASRNQNLLNYYDAASGSPPAIRTWVAIGTAYAVDLYLDPEWTSCLDYHKHCQTYTSPRDKTKEYSVISSTYSGGSVIRARLIADQLKADGTSVCHRTILDPWGENGDILSIDVHHKKYNLYERVVFDSNVFDACATPPLFKFYVASNALDTIGDSDSYDSPLSMRLGSNAIAINVL